jgi:hypothetical protein
MARKAAMLLDFSESHEEKKKPVPKGAAQMSKTSRPRLICRY